MRRHDLIKKRDNDKEKYKDKDNDNDKVSQVNGKIFVLSIFVRVHVMSKSIVYISVIAGIQP